MMRKFIILVCAVFCSVVSSGQDSTFRDEFRQFFYPDGKISSEGYMRDGRPDGYWKSYYENGRLKSEGNRLDFELDSLWKFYDNEGKQVLEITYKHGKRNGYKTSWLDREMIREYFVDDIKEGYTDYYHPDGWKKMDIPYDRGLEQGFGREYSREGEIITLTEYKKGFIVGRIKINRRDRNNLKQGKWISFWENGKIRTEGTYRNDKKNGYFKEYSEKGDLIRILKYIVGILQPDAEEIQKLDVEKEYYTDGKIKSSTLYRNGVREGIRREFSPEGEITRALEYSNGYVVGEGLVQEDGSREGLWKEFYPEGGVKAEGQYENGIKTGIWKYFHPNGTLEQTGKYNKNGDPEGTWKWFYDSGRLLREENYYRGRKDGLSEEYDEEGNLIEQGTYYNGLEDGDWIQLVGDFYQRGSYREGLRSGVWISYLLQETGATKDSILIFKGGFLDDLPDGKHVHYWDNGKIREEGIYVVGKKEGEWIRYNYDGTLFMSISFRNGIETRYDGVKIKPPFEPEQ